MSREDIRLEGYEPGGGFQLAKLVSISLREFLTLVAAYAIIALLRAYLGNQATLAALGAVSGAAFMAIGTRDTLNPERREEGKTEKGARRVRIVGIVVIVIGTAVVTLALRSVLFLAEGW
jgi:hypothetical protein